MWCPWHCRPKATESPKWFSFGYHLNFGKIWCSIAALVVLSCLGKLKSDECCVHSISHRQTASNWHCFLAGNNSYITMKISLTIPTRRYLLGFIYFAGKLGLIFFEQISYTCTYTPTVEPQFLNRISFLWQGEPIGS